MNKEAKQLDMFYNTTMMGLTEITQRRQTASKQCWMILHFFKGNPEGNFTPFEVQKHANLQTYPITSIRRAINTLTGAGLLIKTNIMREGEYGAMNHTWKLAK